MSERFYLETQKTYDAHSREITDAAKSAHIAYLPKFASVLPPGGFLVDLGCGSGRDARLFMDHGLAYLGVDFSLKTIELAKKSAPYARFEHKDIRSLNLLSETVDGFWAPDVLYHLSKQDFEVFMGKAFGWLKPGGHFFMIMKMGSGEGYVNAPALGGMYYSYYEKDELENIVKKLGYKIYESKIIRRELMQAASKKAYGVEDVLVLWLTKTKKTRE